MTYIIAEPCVDLKDRSCVDVCPVDCIHEANRILVIDLRNASTATVDRLLEDYLDGDGGAGVREPRRPSPESPERDDAIDPEK